MIRIKKFFKFCLLLIILAPSHAFGANISVSPLIINHSTEARDILKKDITIKNNENRRIRIFASVHEIDPESKSEILTFVPASMSDRTSSVTSWLEITRGRIELDPQEEITVPLTIRINPNVKPGEYHAFVGFAGASNRDEAEKKVITAKAQGVMVRIAIEDKSRELLRLNAFNSDQFVLSEDKHNFTFVIENVGDKPLTPSGEVIIYDAKGNELDSVKINTAGQEIKPNEKIEFKEPVPATGNLGRNKAFLALEYGVNNAALVHDTHFYYSVPWTYLFLLITLLLIVPIVLTLALKSIFAKNSYEVTMDDGDEVKVFVNKTHDHKIHDHDIDLRK